MLRFIFVAAILFDVAAAWYLSNSDIKCAEGSITSLFVDCAR